MVPVSLACLQRHPDVPRAQDPGSEGLDMIIMPGVTFDRSFSRLGYGKGFYDRFLSAYTSSAPSSQMTSTSGATDSSRRSIPQLGETISDGALLSDYRLIVTLTTQVAVALQEHVLDEGAVPIDETDWKVDAIVSPTIASQDMVLRRSSDSGRP